jgi:hypothetical protein
MADDVSRINSRDQDHYYINETLTRNLTEHRGIQQRCSVISGVYTSSTHGVPLEPVLAPPA